jgi:hypothetical protein
MTGTWTPLTNLLPDAVGPSAQMLLSDGTVMIQGGGGVFASKNWYKLAPDANGSYIDGTFSPRASMGLERAFFPSNVLPNGDVFVMGGEYSGPSTTQNFTNTGELYDPVADAWTPLPHHPEAEFGDDPTVVLPNGKILAGSLTTPNTYLFDPATNTWSFAATKLRGDRSDEETWTLLPDGSVLSYDIFSTVSTGISTAQRYIPSTNTWVDAGVVPVPLTSSAVGFELGPALLLPDGRVPGPGLRPHRPLRPLDLHLDGRPVHSRRPGGRRCPGRHSAQRACDVRRRYAVLQPADQHVRLRPGLEHAHRRDADRGAWGGTRQRSVPGGTHARLA